ncbi:MAG: LytTR family transcriptional regulator [Oscillospiraceae bacterium]|nr:LytTR family transcriptional regulator [Oscillospiraceae bacterium]
METTDIVGIKNIELQQDNIVVTNKGNEYVIEIKDILYVESFNKTAEINVTGENRSIYEVKTRIGDIYKLLEGYGFIMIHKSYIVNMAHIDKFKNYMIFLSDGQVIRASQRRWKNIFFKIKNR